MSKTMELFSFEIFMVDSYTYACPRTEEELKAYRDAMAGVVAADGYSVGDNCDGCARRYVCTLVLHPYNTDGNCLYSK